ncbi:MAG: M48 family metallopeptidase, partial [Treponema sp.]|nr:M48 family metallopeptidase [Treponema sp.]
KLCYDEVEDSLNKALLFYGDKLTKDFLSADSNLLLNDKKARRALGTFTPFTNEITLNEVRQLLKNNQLDCVLVHELAHFFDHNKRSRFSRDNYASSQRGRKERIIAELFRSKMIPVPEKRTNYRGKTCELFARAIEEYYAIVTDNKEWIKERGNYDYYINIETYKKIFIQLFMNILKKAKAFEIETSFSPYHTLIVLHSTIQSIKRKAQTLQKES